VAVIIWDIIHIFPERLAAVLTTFDVFNVTGRPRARL